MGFGAWWRRTVVSVVASFAVALASEALAQSEDLEALNVQVQQLYAAGKYAGGCLCC